MSSYGSYVNRGALFLVTFSLASCLRWFMGPPGPESFPLLQLACAEVLMVAGLALQGVHVERLARLEREAGREVR